MKTFLQIITSSKKSNSLEEPEDLQLSNIQCIPTNEYAGSTDGILRLDSPVFDVIFFDLRLILEFTRMSLSKKKVKKYGIKSIQYAPNPSGK